ncbi:MAG: serine/threonine-protein kinase, partial [Lysobacteraceae bacterium]
MTAGGDETLAWPHVEGYRIEAVIGRGGMATVYRARQVSLDRTVAIKLMARRDDDDASAERFAHEARIIAGLEHPGIVGIHDVGRLPDGRLFYAMPWLPGGDLAGRELRGDQRAILGILRVLLGALGHAHAHGVVHRDVKPENVLFDANGQPRLADFGIALGGRRPASRITREGMALGSGGYMAPEQARGEALDGRADLYGVGVLAYEMLTGELPFHAE